MSVDLPLPLGPSRPSLVLGARVKLTSRKKFAPAERFGDALEFDELAGLSPRSVELDGGGTLLRVALSQVAKLFHHVAGAFDTSLRLGGSCFGAAVKPLDFPPNAARQRAFATGLGGEEFLAFHEKFAVAAVVTEEPVGIRPPEFDRAAGNIFEKPAIVTHG